MTTIAAQTAFPGLEPPAPRPEPIRAAITLVIEMTGEQVQAYADARGLPRAGGPLRAVEVVQDVRAAALAAVAQPGAFGPGGATVTVRR